MVWGLHQLHVSPFYIYIYAFSLPICHTPRLFPFPVFLSFCCMYNMPTIYHYNNNNNNQYYLLRRLLIYNTILAIFLLFPIVYFSGELDLLKITPMVWDSYFWFVMTVTGIMGFLINISTFLQIKVTSPLTHNLSGTAKVSVHRV